MAETMEAARTAQPMQRPSGFPARLGSKAQWGALVVVVVIVGFGCYFLGWNSARNDITNLKEQVGKLQGDNQKLTQTNDDQTKQITNLQSQLKTAQSRLDDVFLAYRTIDLSANELTPISTGHFSIGLIGPPSTDKINININGKQQSAAVGDTIDVGTIAASCRVTIKSFDMFKVSVTTNCVPANP